ncbi:hypothetical protein ABTL61_19875, partial [Acinetobacter baumannii]
NSAQKKLARELTRLVHGEEGLREALESTHLMNPGKNTFNEEHVDKMLATMPYIDVKRADVLEKNYIDLITEVGLVSSKGEARRL